MISIAGLIVCIFIMMLIILIINHMNMQRALNYEHKKISLATEKNNKDKSVKIVPVNSITEIHKLMNEIKHQQKKLSILQKKTKKRRKKRTK